MIDWVSGKFPFFADGLVSDGQFLVIDALGEVENDLARRLQVEGSYSSKILLRTFEVDAKRNTVSVEFSGNPVKFLQGHNVFGTSDVVNLIYSCLEKVSNILGIKQPLQFYQAWRAAEGRLSRVDINYMFALGSLENVKQWIYSSSNSSRTRSQSAVTRGSTVYFNRDSKRWSFKAYSKYQEVLLPRNQKPNSFVFSAELLEYLKDKLRIELTLKSNELNELGFQHLQRFSLMSQKKLFDTYLKRVRISQNLKLEQNILLQLRPAVLGSYSKWLNGLDVRQGIHKATFYRHRAELLKYGVDISIAYKDDDLQSEVKYISLLPEPVDGFKIFSDLIFQPKQIYKRKAA